ncbi:hypothetical protein MNBD_GAMMA21-2839 [hydrothermal vent metagenome]|uniref:Uncharacterized protein n=1 Tax=hydrothermal vent metagenome TaxID=652676 RepID=A0A3B1ADK7_9ZZZZ
MKTTELFKHPIFIVIIGVTYFFLLQSYIPETKANNEIRAAYQELQAISKKLAESEEPGHIKEVIQNFSSQVVDGFKSGFKSDNSRLIKFNEAKSNIILSDIKKAKSSWKSKEKITNKSKYSIAQIKINFASFSKDGRLIDVNHKWLSGIKILNPNESVFFEIDRNPGEHTASAEELKANESYSYELRINDFEIKELIDGKES